MEFYMILLALSFMPAAWCKFELSIVHLNDVHSYFFESTAKGIRCTEEDTDKGICMGGIARQVTKIKEIRSKEKNVLVLASGDFYLADSYYPLHGWKLASTMMPYLTLNATSLGNHDFGHGMFETAAYILSLKCPVLACNLIGRNGSFWQSYVNKSISLNVGNETIGIVGYISPETRHWSHTGKSFRLEDEVPCLKREVKKMKSKGINKIIAIGHSGYHMDKVIAKMVPGIDVIVGGNSDVFLETPTGLEVDEEENDSYTYPTVVRQQRKANATTEDITLVVQVPQHGRHIGHLKVIFDDKGRIMNYSGSAILLDSSIPPDPETAAKLNESRNALEKVKNWFHIPDYDEVIGYAPTELEGHHKECRMRECSLGNMVADAIFHAFLNHRLGKQNVSAAVWNSGSIRSSILPGNITFRDLTYALYLGDNVVLHTVTGEKLKDMMEKSVAKYDTTGISLPGSFLQISRMKVEFDMQKPIGERVVNLQIACSTCNDTKYETVVGNESYNIVMPGYFLRGGDGFFKHMGVRYNEQDLTDALAITQYLKEFEPSGQLEGRIAFVKADKGINASVEEKHSGKKRHAFSMSFQEYSEPVLFEKKVKSGTSNDTSVEVTIRNNTGELHFESTTGNRNTMATSTTRAILKNATIPVSEQNLLKNMTFDSVTTKLPFPRRNSNSMQNSDMNESVNHSISLAFTTNDTEIENSHHVEFLVSSEESMKKNGEVPDNIYEFKKHDETQKDKNETSTTADAKKTSSSLFLSTISSVSIVRNLSSTTNNSSPGSSDTVSSAWKSKSVTLLPTEEEAWKNPGTRQTLPEVELELDYIFRDAVTIEEDISESLFTAMNSLHDKFNHMTNTSSESFHPTLSYNHDKDHSNAFLHHKHQEKSPEHANATRGSTSAETFTSTIALNSSQSALNSSSLNLTVLTEAHLSSTGKQGHDLLEEGENINMKTVKPVPDSTESHRTYKKDLSAASRKNRPPSQVVPYVYASLFDWFPASFGGNTAFNRTTAKKTKSNETFVKVNVTETSTRQSIGNLSTSENSRNVSSNEVYSAIAKDLATEKYNQAEPRTVNSSSARDSHEFMIAESSHLNSSLGNATHTVKNCSTSTVALKTENASEPQKPVVVSSTTQRTTLGSQKRPAQRSPRRLPVKTSFWDSLTHFFHHI